MTNTTTQPVSTRGRVLWAIGTSLAALSGCFLFGGCATTVEIQGHRGARGLMPENTLPAFAKALEIGVDMLEFDTGVTGDGVVVISHERCLNPDLARDVNGDWPPASAPHPCINAMGLRELQQYDVGRVRPASEYANKFREQSAIDGTRIPTLASLFEMVKKSGNTLVGFNIETKLEPAFPNEAPAPEAFVDALLGAIEREKMLHRVTIQSFDWRTLKLVQQRYPRVPTVYLSVQQSWMDNIRVSDAGGSHWTAGVQAKDYQGSVPRMVKAAGGAVWSPYFGDVDLSNVKEARSLGLQVIVWTVNEAADIEKMLDLKVNGIISDYPNRVRDAMQKRGMRLPPGMTALKY